MAKRRPEQRDQVHDSRDRFLEQVGVTAHICNVRDCTTMARYRKARKALDRLIRQETQQVAAR